MVTVTQLCKQQKSLNVQVKQVNYMVCKLQLNKYFFKK